MSLFSRSLPNLLREAESVLSQRPRPLTAAQLEARRWPLAKFIREAWHVVEPGTPLAWGWPLEAVATHVEALLTGRLPERNLAITIPPGFAKSTVSSVMAPAWALVTRPWLRFICASGNPSVAVRDSLRCRAIVESDWYARTFGIGWTLADDQNEKMHFKTTAGGSRLALSTGSSVTGTRGDVLLVDDGLDAASAHSAAERAGVNDWFDMAFANRLADMRTGARIVIGQRLHVEDLIGHVLATEPQAWCHLSIPQLFEPERRCVTAIWSDPRTDAGELAFPERFPQSVIDGERRRLGASGFSAQHQQAPYLLGGEIFKRDALQLWGSGTALPCFSRILISADTAFSTKAQADYSALAVIGEFEQGYFLLDMIRARLAYPQLKATMESLADKWHPAAVLIEDMASGQSLVQDLQQNTRLPIVAIKPLGDKLSRAHTCVPTWEAHRCYASADAPWLGDFLDELCAFPKAVHDDQVDALMQGVRYLTGWHDYAGLLEFMRLELVARKHPSVMPATASAA